MTDPFADLERELLAAHSRDAAPRRLPRATPRVLAMAATAAALAAGVVWLGGATDSERAVSPDSRAAAAAAGCDGGWQPPVTQDPVPPEIARRVAALRDGSAAEVDYRPPGAQATRLYGLPVTMPHRGGYDVLAAAADIVPRTQVVEQRDPCAAPKGETQPGVCLMLVDAAGGIVACFTAAELDAGSAFIDTRGRIIGLAPDGARWAVSGEHRAEVEGNTFVLPGGPGTRVDFTP